MSFLTLNLGVLAFADSVKSQQPDIRLADLKWSLQGLHTNNFKQIPVSLAPGETMTIASTARTLSLGAALTVSKVESNMRIKGSFGQAVVKVMSPMNEYKLTRSPNGVCKLEILNGTMTVATAMDIVELNEGFSIRNKGQFAVLKASNTSIEFINDLGTTEAANISGGVTVFTKKIQVGDIIDITSVEFAFPNRGTFPVSKIGADYLEIANPNAFPESVANVTSGITAYPFAYKWMLLAVDHKVIMGLNGSSPSVIEIEPPVEGDIAKNPGLFLKRGKVFEVSLYNSGVEVVNGFLILAE